MTIGKRIQAARKAASLTQKELAHKLGVTASMIGQYENDLRNPKFTTMQKIANALEVEVSVLFPQDFLEFIELRPDEMLFVGNDDGLYTKPRNTILPSEFNEFEQFIETFDCYIRLEDDHYRLHKGQCSAPLTVGELQALVKQSKATVGALVQTLMEQKENPPQE